MDSVTAVCDDTLYAEFKV